MKLWVKIIAAVLGVLIISIFTLYSFFLTPIVTHLNLENMTFKSSRTQTTGFPFHTTIIINKPELWSSDTLLWKGDRVKLEWRITHPTSFTVHLQGTHIVTIRQEKLTTATPSKKLYFADATGFLRLANLNHMVFDIKGQKIGLYTGNIRNPGQHFKTLGIDTLYLSYDGPSRLSQDEEGGNINVSAEKVEIPQAFNPPFSSPIKRLSYRSQYDEKTNRYRVSNIILFWDDLRVAGNGTTASHAGGDYIIAIVGFEKLVRQLYKNNNLPPDRLANLVKEFNKLQDQQKKAVNMPIYMPASYRDGVMRIMNIPVFSVPDFYSPELSRLRK